MLVNTASDGIAKAGNVCSIFGFFSKKYDC